VDGPDGDEEYSVLIDQDDEKPDLKQDAQLVEALKRVKTAPTQQEPIKVGKPL
jgi:hypothetical protein